MPIDNQRLTQKIFNDLEDSKYKSKGKKILSMNVISMQRIHQRQSIK